MTGVQTCALPILVADGRPGPLTGQIQEIYFATVRGEVPKYKDWLDHVD